MTGYNESFHYWSIALKEKDKGTSLKQETIFSL